MSIDVADTRSPRRFLLWLARMQRRNVGWGVFWACLWMVSMALTPYAIGRTVDEIVVRSQTGILIGTGGVLGLALATALGSVMRHRCDTINRFRAVYRTAELVTAQGVRLGATLPRRTSAGDLAAVGTSDLIHIGAALGVVARGIAGAVTIVLVAGLLLRTSVLLGLLILIGVPLLLAVNGPLLAPLHKRMRHQRSLRADVAGRATDIVAGLRILRGVGGEATFAGRYRAESQRVRDAGVRVARIDSMLVAAEVLLPGVFVVAVLWIGAHLAIAGTITPGDLVAFYGYAAFLMIPMRTVTATLTELTGALVAARQILAVLTLEPDEDKGGPDVVVPAGAELVDTVSGLHVRPGSFTAVVPEDPEQGRILADRIAGGEAGEVTLGGVPVNELPTAQRRRHILVSDDASYLFTGTVAEVVGASSTERLAEVIHQAAATDVVESLGDATKAVVTDRGMSLSGGQRQRIRLARALAADPPVLVLLDPASALDAHTEAAVAERLREARRGRTTVTVTTSPLVLDRADEVAYLSSGVVVATGTHAELLQSHPRYGATVLREES